MFVYLHVCLSVCLSVLNNSLCKRKKISSLIIHNDDDDDDDNNDNEDDNDNNNNHFEDTFNQETGGKYVVLNTQWSVILIKRRRECGVR